MEQVCWTCLELSISLSVWANFVNIFRPIKYVDFKFDNRRIRYKGLMSLTLLRHDVTEIGRPSVKLVRWASQCQDQSVYQTYLVLRNVAILFCIIVKHMISGNSWTLSRESLKMSPNINTHGWSLFSSYLNIIKVVAISSVCYPTIFISGWTLSREPRQCTCPSHL